MLKTQVLQLIKVRIEVFFFSSNYYFIFGVILLELRSFVLTDTNNTDAIVKIYKTQVGRQVVHNVHGVEEVGLIIQPKLETSVSTNQSDNKGKLYFQIEITANLCFCFQSRYHK